MANNAVHASTGAEFLTRDIRRTIDTGQLRDGERLAPIRKLAQDYGTSFPTARAAIGRLEQLGLVERRRGSGTYVISRPRQGFTFTSACLLLDGHRHVYGRLAACLADQLQLSTVHAVNATWSRERGAEQLANVFATWQASGDSPHIGGSIDVFS